MLNLLKYELEYFGLLFTLIIVLPLSFTVFAFSDIKVLAQVYFLKKYIWSVIVGLGIYGLVFIIWNLRKKEFRERSHKLLPIAINEISIARWFLGVSPFVLVGLYIELLHAVLPLEQQIFIARINGQLGMMFIALVGIDLIINTWYALGSKRYDKRIAYIVLITFVVALLSFGVVCSVTMAILKPFSFCSEEVYFLLWGIILSIIDAAIFTKRKTFLS